MANFRSPRPLGLNMDGVEKTSISTSQTTNSANAKAAAKENNEDIRLIGSIDELRDGDVRSCDVSDYAMFFLTDKSSRRVARAKRRGSYPVIFVNGMQGSPIKFRAQACAVAALSGGPVWGVYNGSGDSFLFGDNRGKAQIAGNGPGNILVDLLECFTDKVQSTDWDQLTTWFKKKRGVPQQQIENEMISNLSRFNRAAGSLYELLLKPGFENARIVAHSQGNIITCNAINALAATRGNKAIAKIKIHAVASPVMFWSEAGMFGEDIVTTHALTNDFVTWLGANVSDLPFLIFRAPVNREGDAMKGTEIYERYKWTFDPQHILTHNFYAYLEKIWTELRPEFE